MIPAGTILFASDDSPEAVTDARAYISRQGYTRDDCKLVQRDGQTLIIAERDLGEK